MTLREFENIFKRLYLPLCMYALRIVGTNDDAEDIVEESFVKAWQIISGGGVLERPEAWLYRAVRNGCVSFLRSRRETTDLVEVAEFSEEDADTSVRDARIGRAVDGLPDKCREIFLMSKRDGLSNDEIAAELGISVKTVKNQLTKAFSRLRDALSDGHRPFFLPFL